MDLASAAFRVCMGVGGGEQTSAEHTLPQYRRSHSIRYLSTRYPKRTLSVPHSRSVRYLSHTLPQYDTPIAYPRSVHTKSAISAPHNARHSACAISVTAHRLADAADVSTA
eukprot:2242497-Rhodomonas_salina.1